MKEHIISTFEEFHKLISQFNLPHYIFRGQGNADWNLLPKIGRDPYFKQLSQLLTEKIALEGWKRYSLHYLQKEPIDNWDWLVLAQHYGLATRLMDWTKNPLVALYFAVIDSVSMNTDSAVFALDYNYALISTSKVQPFDLKFSGVFFPKGISARILSQRSVFTINHEPNIELNELTKSEFVFTKITIKKTNIKSILKGLEFYGINELSIFQDLENLSKYLNRYLLEHDSDAFPRDLHT